MKKLSMILLAVATVLTGPVLAQMQMRTDAPPKTVAGTGTIKKVDAAKRVVNLSHGPIPAINWPAMTMDFAVAPEVNMATLKPGQAVEFTLAQGQGKDYVITSVKPKP
ncbi:MAG: copper-binding protein [Rhodospirillaceae bacterium]|nr:copper-binding protein [Rhodospirillaceae bacterium]